MKILVRSVDPVYSYNLPSPTIRTIHQGVVATQKDTDRAPEVFEFTPKEWRELHPVLAPIVEAHFPHLGYSLGVSTLFGGVRIEVPEVPS